MPENPSARVAWWLDRDVLTARGPESGEFLQGQLSQDVLALAVGGSAWTWVLSPQGKIDALARVARLSAEDWVLDTEGGGGAPLAARLTRFRLRTKVEIEEVNWKVLALRSSADDLPSAVPTPGVEVVARAWPGMEGVDLIGPEPAVPEGWELGDLAGYEALRILAGVPRAGAELDERTIPAETGLVPLTVSFTKGCYTGQELVARIDSRGGNVPRRMRLMRAESAVEPGDLVDDAGGAAGVLTSVAPDPGGGWVGLGYTKRSVEVPARLRTAEGGVDVTVEPLEQ